MQTFGVKCTFAKNMIKNNCSTPQEYRNLRKKKKQAEHERIRAKHKQALLGRKAKSAKTVTNKKEKSNPVKS